jgi:hypothetical protein
MQSRRLRQFSGVGVVDGACSVVVAVCLAAAVVGGEFDGLAAAFAAFPALPYHSGRVFHFRTQPS